MFDSFEGFLAVIFIGTIFFSTVVVSIVWFVFWVKRNGINKDHNLNWCCTWIVGWIVTISTELRLTCESVYLIAGTSELPLQLYKWSPESARSRSWFWKGLLSWIFCNFFSNGTKTAEAKPSQSIVQHSSCFCPHSLLHLVFFVLPATLCFVPLPLFFYEFLLPLSCLKTVVKQGKAVA